MITLLATFVLLDIGLCFSTPAAVDWSIATFQLRDVDGYLGGLLMIGQAALDFVLLVLIFCIGVFWRPGLRSSNSKKDPHD